MSKLKVGERVRVKDRIDWPSPPGYRLAASEGVVTKIWESGGLEVFQDYIQVKLEKSGPDVDISHTYNFRIENLERI